MKYFSTSVQGTFYKIGTYTEITGPATLAGRTIMAARTLGTRGFQTLWTQPFFLVAITSSGTLFFHGLGVINGNNVVGRSFNTIGITLNMPLYLCE